MIKMKKTLSILLAVLAVVCCGRVQQAPAVNPAEYESPNPEN